MSKKANKRDSLDTIIENTFNHIKDIVDANTVVGNIMQIGNKLFLIPVSRISVGLISGGGVLPKGNKNVNAGSGTGFNIEPIGFITISDMNFDFITVNKTSDLSKTLIESVINLYDKLIEKEKENGNEE